MGYTMARQQPAVSVTGPAPRVSQLLPASISFSLLYSGDDRTRYKRKENSHNVQNKAMAATEKPLESCTRPWTSENLKSSWAEDRSLRTVKCAETSHYTIEETGWRRNTPPRPPVCGCAQSIVAAVLILLMPGRRAERLAGDKLVATVSCG